MEIKSISQKIFRTNSTKLPENNSNHSNPFGVSFNGNIISADVFESKENKQDLTFKGAELAAKAAGKCKMTASAAIGTISNWISGIGSRLDSTLNFTKRIEAVRNFGRKVGERVNNAWNYLTTTNLVINIDTVKRTKDLFAMKINNRNPYENKAVNDLDTLLCDAIAE